MMQPSNYTATEGTSSQTDTNRQIEGRYDKHLHKVLPAQQKLGDSTQSKGD